MNHLHFQKNASNIDIFKSCFFHYWPVCDISAGERTEERFKQMCMATNIYVAFTAGKTPDQEDGTLLLFFSIRS